MLQFIRNLAGVKTDQVVQAGVEALVRWDPQSASEAELRSMEQHLDELGQQVLEKTYAEAGGKLREGRAQLERAQRDMARAGQQRQMAERQADAARRAAGLSTTTSSLNVALKAMQDTTARDLANAESANMKAKLLRPTQPEQDDANIARAMDFAAGKPAAPINLTDRLAALRTRS
jgi:hypothetical protein